MIRSLAWLPPAGTDRLLQRIFRLRWCTTSLSSYNTYLDELPYHLYRIWRGSLLSSRCIDDAMLFLCNSFLYILISRRDTIYHSSRIQLSRKSSRVRTRRLTGLSRTALSPIDVHHNWWVCCGCRMWIYTSSGGSPSHYNYLSDVMVLMRFHPVWNSFLQQSSAIKSNGKPYQIPQK